MWLLDSLKKIIVGTVTFILIVTVLFFGFGSLAIINFPRVLIPFKSFKILLSKISNFIGDIIVYCCRVIMFVMHQNSIQIIDDNHFDRSKWYLAMSNHQSWADIFIILAAGNFRIPLIKFFMKKELAWIPFIYLANKTLNMPFVSRHSKEALQKNPSLRQEDYRNTLDACRRFKRSPSTVFSYAEGTRNNSEKFKLQKSPYKHLLKPKSGGMATAISAIDSIDTLVDFSLIYKSNKRSAWSFLNGEMKDVKVLIKKYKIPEHLKNKNYSIDEKYRDDFKDWIEVIWEQKDKEIEKLKY
ncbi:acetyltransferase [Gammaproteobacteria bacterium]|nr:acetyltransferase [Gammaproteobacteria bacterium]